MEPRAEARSGSAPEQAVLARLRVDLGAFLRFCRVLRRGPRRASSRPHAGGFTRATGAGSSTSRVRRSQRARRRYRRPARRKARRRRGPPRRCPLQAPGIASAASRSVTPSSRMVRAARLCIFWWSSAAAAGAARGGARPMRVAHARRPRRSSASSPRDSSTRGRSERSRTASRSSDAAARPGSPASVRAPALLDRRQHGLHDLRAGGPGPTAACRTSQPGPGASVWMRPRREVGSGTRPWSGRRSSHRTRRRGRPAPFARSMSCRIWPVSQRAVELAPRAGVC